MALYVPGGMINDPLYGQTSYNSCVCNTIRLKLYYNLNQVLVEMKTATWIGIAQHVIIPGKVLSGSRVMDNWHPLANQYASSSEKSDENERVENEVAGRKGIGSSGNVSSDWVNRIDYIPHIYWVQMHDCEIPNITMNFLSAGVWALQPNVYRTNWRQSMRTKRSLTNLHGRFRS